MLKKPLVLETLGVLIFLLVWHLISTYRFMPAYAIPSPARVVEALAANSHAIAAAIPQSLLHLALGFTLAFAVAVPLGMLMGSFKSVERGLFGVVEVLRPIPPIAWVPFALLLFATYLEASMFIIFIGAFFPLLTNVYFGFKNVPTSLIEVVRVMGGGGKEILVKVSLPSALPSILTGVKTSIGVAWMCVVAAEMFGAPGLGYLIMNYRYLHDIAAVVAVMVVIGFLGLALEVAVKLIENRVLRWQKGLMGVSR